MFRWQASKPFGQALRPEPAERPNIRTLFACQQPANMREG